MITVKSVGLVLAGTVVFFILKPTVEFLGMFVVISIAQSLGML